MSFKVREEHLIILIEFMEEHREFATGRLSVSNSREEFKKLWSVLGVKLNSLGHGEKTVEKWQKTWSDYKGNLKKKAAEIRRFRDTTGGGPELQKKLSLLESRALGLLGETFYAGCGISERGLSIPTARVSEETNKDDSMASTSKTVHSKDTVDTSRNDHDYLFFSPNIETPKKRKKMDKESIYEDTISSLSSIESTVKNGLENINRTLKDGLENLRKTMEQSQNKHRCNNCDKQSDL